MPPLAAWWIELWGWRGAYLGLAALTLLAAVPAALLLGGRAATRAKAAGTALPGMTLREAMSSRLFWLMYAVAFLICVGFFVPMVHLVPYAQDVGLSEAQGVSLVSLLGLGSLLGRFAMGGIADRLGHARSLVAIGAGLGADVPAVVGGGRASGCSPCSRSCFGTLYGGYVALAPTLCMELFGPRSLSAILGMPLHGGGARHADRADFRGRELRRLRQLRRVDPRLRGAVLRRRRARAAMRRHFARAGMSRRPALTVSEERGVRTLHVGGEAIQSSMRLSATLSRSSSTTRAA